METPEMNPKIPLAVALPLDAEAIERLVDVAVAKAIAQMADKAAEVKVVVEPTLVEEREIQRIYRVVNQGTQYRVVQHSDSEGNSRWDVIARRGKRGERICDPELPVHQRVVKAVLEGNGNKKERMP